MRRSSFVLLALAACSSSERVSSDEDAILGGRLETRFPAVGYLVDGDSVTCTATLIEPDLVVTAAHCIRGNEFRFGWGEVSAHTTALASGVAVHPRYLDPNQDLSAAAHYDVALLRLAEPVPVSPMSIGALPVLGSAAFALGYGSTSWVLDGGAYHAEGSGEERKSADITIVNTNAIETFARFAPGSSACYGDSGGPIVSSDSHVVGVLSHFVGATRCRPEDRTLMGYTRVDDAMDAFFTNARECLGDGDPNGDVAHCLALPERHLCAQVVSTDVARPHAVTLNTGDANDGSAYIDLPAHAERAVLLPPRTATVNTRTRLQLFAQDDARMTVKVNGGTVFVATNEVVYGVSDTIEVDIASCAGREQLTTLVWSPE